MQQVPTAWRETIREALQRNEDLEASSVAATVAQVAVVTTRVLNNPGLELESAGAGLHPCLLLHAVFCL